MRDDPRAVLIAPVVSEKSYGMIGERGKYTFRVHPDAHKTQIRQAVESVFEVDVDRRERLQGAGEAEAPRDDARHPLGLEEGRRDGRPRPDHRSLRTGGVGAWPFGSSSPPRPAAAS